MYARYLLCCRPKNGERSYTRQTEIRCSRDWPHHRGHQRETSASTRKKTWASGKEGWKSQTFEFFALRNRVILLPFQASPPSFLTGEGEAGGGGEVELGSTVEELQQSPRPARVWGRRGGTQVNRAVLQHTLPCQLHPRFVLCTLCALCSVQ